MGSVDPVSALPGDLVALCLSFLDVHTLLGAAQFVSHAWRDAIDGGLPAVWHEVCVGWPITDAQLANVVQRSHGVIRTLKLTLEQPAFFRRYESNSLHSLSELRVLDLDASYQEMGDALTWFPLLERISAVCWNTLVFPTLRFLATVQCRACRVVKGLHNLPALTKFDSDDCSVDAGAPWPASLSDVSIHESPYDPLIFDRIAALQHMIALDTDWSFIDHSSSTTLFVPPYDQLSFLARSATLQRLSVSLFVPGSVALLNHLGGMFSLRELHLADIDMTGRDMQCVSQLANLESVSLLALTNLTSKDLFLITPLPNLTKLYVRHCYPLTDLTPIAACTKLRRLAIAHDHHRMSSAEILVIAMQQHLDSLHLCVLSAEPQHIAWICTMRSLRELVLSLRSFYDPVCVYSPLPGLSSLEVLEIHHSFSDEDMTKLVGYLVQMPRLRRVYPGCSYPDRKHMQRLRKALPRLIM